MMMCGTAPLEAATLYVPGGGDLQAALNSAQPGDTILLEPGAEYVGNFLLPVKDGSVPIVVRSATPDADVPGIGQRIAPGHAPLLARLRSPNTAAALRTAAGTRGWHLQYLELAGNVNGHGDIMQIGDGSSAQTTLASVPRDLVLSHLYIHGHPQLGQKRCISLHAAQVTIRDSYIADCKGVGMDTQAIAGWNGPGPYTIENNYLEAAGENVMFGGSDPAISNLVPADIVVRRNYFSRPMAWRSPILATPSGVTLQVEAGGLLEAGTYGYRVVARGPVGQGTTGRSTASAEVTAAVGKGGAVRIRWQAVAGATEYRVYGRTPGGQSMYWRATGAEFVDTGGAGTAEHVPTSEGTVWTVKNIFELKNARNVLVEHNIFENHWKQAQPGWAVVFTPRNSGGNCPWCTVEDVTFQFNVVRNVAAGINILGSDGSRITRQTARLVFRHNLFHDVTTALGGNGWFMQIGDAPRDITIEHNTIDHNGTTVVYTYGGTSTDPREVYGLRVTDNAVRHGSYGFSGSFFAYGNGILTAYYPDAVFVGNYLAGGSASRYPPGNLFSGSFPDQFVNVAEKDFTVRAGSILRAAATDGTDIGVDSAALSEALAGVQLGITAAGAGTNAAPTADFAAACTDLACAFSDRSTDADGTVVAWAWNFGDGNASSLRNPAHPYAAAGTYTVMLLVTDDRGATASISRTVTAAAPSVAPNASFTFKCTNLTCAFNDTSTDSDGRVTGWRWTFGSAGASSQQHPSYTFPSGGSYAVTLTATDDLGAGASMTRTVSVTTSNAAPVAAFTWACADLTCRFTDASTDADGVVQTWSWTFGDGGTASSRNPSRTYSAPGSYNVILAVSDDRGGTASTSRTVDVFLQTHAGDLSGAAAKVKSSWSASVTVTVHAGDERPVAGATVGYAWSDGLTGTGTCTTDSAGTCAVSAEMANKIASVTFAVRSITAPGRVYVASANHDPDGSSDGTTITLRRP